MWIRSDMVDGREMGENDVKEGKAQDHPTEVREGRSLFAACIDSSAHARALIRTCARPRAHGRGTSDSGSDGLAAADGKRPLFEILNHNPHDKCR